MTDESQIDKLEKELKELRESVEDHTRLTDETRSCLHIFVFAVFGIACGVVFAVKGLTNPIAGTAIMFGVAGAFLGYFFALLRSGR